MFFNGYTTKLIYRDVCNQFRLIDRKHKRCIPSYTQKWYMNGNFVESYIFLIEYIIVNLVLFTCEKIIHAI